MCRSVVFKTCDMYYGHKIRSDTSFPFLWYVLSSYKHWTPAYLAFLGEIFGLCMQLPVPCFCDFCIPSFHLVLHLLFSHLPYIYRLKVRFKLLCSILKFSLFYSFLLPLYVVVIVIVIIRDSVSWLLTSLLHLFLCLTCVFSDGCKMTWFFSCRIFSSNSIPGSEFKSICPCSRFLLFPLFGLLLFDLVDCRIRHYKVLVCILGRWPLKKLKRSICHLWQVYPKATIGLTELVKAICSSPQLH